MGVDALLPAVRGLAAQPEALGAAQDADGLEVGGLEQDVRGRVGNLAVLAAHDPGDRERTLAVGDQEVGRVELAEDAVQGSDLLAGAGTPDDDASVAEAVGVEGVQRAAERVHDVVGHVDDVRDRAHSGRGQARLQPGRRGRDPGVAEEAADVDRAAFGVLDRDGDLLVGRRARDRSPARASARRS